MRMLQEELHVRRRWLTGTKMLKQETQEGDMDISRMEIYEIVHCFQDLPKMTAKSSTRLTKDLNT